LSPRIVASRNGRAPNPGRPVLTEPYPRNTTKTVGAAGVASQFRRPRGADLAVAAYLLGWGRTFSPGRAVSNPGDNPSWTVDATEAAGRGQRIPDRPVSARGNRTNRDNARSGIELGNQGVVGDVAQPNTTARSAGRRTGRQGPAPSAP
jgi:hypothetical protein